MITIHTGTGLVALALLAAAPAQPPPIAPSGASPTTVARAAVAHAAVARAADWPPTLAPAAGTRVRRTYTRATELESTAVERFQNGETMALEVTLTVAQRESATVLDRFTAVEDGRVNGLERTFEELSFEALESADGQSSEAALDSALEGETVTFRRDADGDEWERAFDEDSEADDDLLEGLAFDMDLALLLPDGDVAEGDTWSLPAAAARRLMFPAGDLQFDWGEGSELEAATDEAADDYWERAEGGVEVTFTGREEVDGEEHALFELAIELEGVGRSSEELDDVDGERYVELDRTFEAEGVLRWNLDRAHLHSLAFEGEQTTARTTAVELESPEGETFHAGQRLTLEGSLTMALAVTPLDSDDE